MIYTETKLAGAFVIDIGPIRDDRGFFTYLFDARDAASHGLRTNVAQIKLSYNNFKGTLQDLVEGNSWGWGSAEILALFGVAAIALPAFVYVENRAKAPMVQFDLLSDRNFLGAVVVALVISFSMLGVFFFLALYMQDILGYSPLEAGIRFLPSTLMIVGVAPVAGRLADRFGPRWLIVGGLVIVSASLFTFSGIAVDSQLPRPAARLHAARHRHRDDDVADDQRRDERGAGAESGQRLGRALNVPHGWRRSRHRRHRRDLPGLGQFATRRSARQQRRLGCPAGLDLRTARQRGPSPTFRGSIPVWPIRSPLPATKRLSTRLARR